MQIFTIQIQGGISYKCSSKETLTAALQRQNLKVIAPGCRVGGCGACKIQVHQGQVEHGRLNSILVTSEEISQGFSLACQTKPLSDLVILLPSTSEQS